MDMRTLLSHIQALSLTLNEPHPKRGEESPDPLTEGDLPWDVHPLDSREGMSPSGESNKILSYLNRFQLVLNWPTW